MKFSSSKYKTEKALIKACIKGKSVAQKELYDIFSSKMFGVCLRYAKNHHNAEDLLQEGFVKVFKNIQKFRSEGSFEGWMRRIFVNTAIEHYRKNNPLYPVNDNQMPEVDFIDNTALNNLAVNDLMQMINQLSPGYRTIFNLYVIEGFSHKEIAEMLKINEGTSKSQLARSRYILQQVILKYQESQYEAII